MEANKTMRGQAVPNHSRRTDKESESNSDSAAHNQTIKHQKQLNDKNHHIPTNTKLNVKGLNFPIKRHHLANWNKKEDQTICCLKETHLINRKKHWVQVKGWKKIYQANGPPKQAGIAILTSNKVDFKLTLIK
jgi:hypothetical protein